MTNELTHLDLFSGIGGFSLAFEAEGFRTIGFVECDEIKRIVLRHWWPGVPILPDIRDTAAIVEFCRPHGTIDILTGGVPCQPASALGQQRGTSDERWLWPETIRLVGAIRPRFALFENPPAILTLEGGRAWNGIVSGLVALRYDLWWDVFPAAAFGAGHLRERVLLVATNADCNRGAAGVCEASAESEGGRKGWLGPNGENKIRSPADAARIGKRIKANENHTVVGIGAARNGTASDGHLSSIAHANDPRLQGYAGNEDRSGGGQSEKRPTAPEDLRGRVFATEEGQPPWWHETNTGIPVLANGIPSKLAESFAKCTGDAVVPQAIQPIARAINHLNDA